ncbi:MAG: hypothetical protein OXG40_01230 [Acidimicrobiaceae bacterium]|nr:hypothetical protein [Acidimicrobiaceae bacterium]MDE0517604.1 hypothetical protein [Acidimicrobiaceae bacterium]MDE0655891.1 hypothetical protein [Acidimicrobiaceae bacterium]
MPSQSDLRKRRVRAARQSTGSGQRTSSRRDRQRRLVAVVAVLVVTMMVASLAVGLLA